MELYREPRSGSSNPILYQPVFTPGWATWGLQQLEAPPPRARTQTHNRPAPTLIDRGPVCGVYSHVHRHFDRLQHLEIPSTNTDTFQHCDSRILHARPSVSGSLRFRRSASEVASCSRINNSAVCGRARLKSPADHTQNGCLLPGSATVGCLRRLFWYFCLQKK